jgi:putative phage-type endonuclease
MKPNNLEIIMPDSHDHWLKMKSEDVSSTEVAALFGLSPWITKFELWHRKKNGSIVSIDENQRMFWGRHLEPAIAAGIAEDNGWIMKPFKEYARLKGERTGSSFDFLIAIPEKISNIVVKTTEALLEIKNIDYLQFKDKWALNDNGELIEAPPYYEIQIQQQLMVTGLDTVWIGVLVGGNDYRLLKRTRDEKVIKRIKEEIKKFWDSIDKNQPPEIDFKRDAAFISELYNMAEPGKIIDAVGDDDIGLLVELYNKFASAEKEMKKEKEAIKAELLTKIGDAEKVKGDGFSISAGIVGESQVSFTRKSYRNFRVFKNKKKGETK